MCDNELKEWFFNKFYSCYYVENEYYPSNTFMYYDKDFIRKSKFAVLQGKKIEYPTKPIGICLFELDYKFGCLRCDYDHIWTFFESNSNYNYQEIRELIKGWLEEDVKLNVLRPILLYVNTFRKLEEDVKLKVLRPTHNKVYFNSLMAQDLKFILWRII